MKISVFMPLFNSRLNRLKEVSEQSIMDIVNDIVKPVAYIPYEKKIELVDSVIQSAKGQKYETPFRYRQLIIALINAYTNLEMAIDDFDTLSMNGLLNPIMMTFKSEYIICESLMKMMVDDSVLMDDGR